MTSTITIIGAGGFVGTRLIESLVLDRHPEVRAVVRAYRSLASLARLGPRVMAYIADARDCGTLAPALRGSDIVVNLTTGPPAEILPTTKSIYEACVAANVRRLIHLSSAVVYGEVTSPSVDDDAPPLKGHWMPYARAKGAAEIWLRKQSNVARCQVAVLRPGTVWGVRSPFTMGTVSALLQKRAYLVGDGQGVCNAINVDNLVACIRACCDDPGDIRGFYNVADQEHVTWRDFYSALAGPLGYDMNQMPSVSGELFPWSTRAVLEYVQLMPVMNDLYFQLKARLPDAAKSQIKGWLSGRYDYERSVTSYVTRPGVDRELWHLQKVRHKLPVAKFTGRFGFTPPVTFEDGISQTLRWLSFLGCEPCQATALTEYR